MRTLTSVAMSVGFLLLVACGLLLFAVWKVRVTAAKAYAKARRR
jgi:hypothetical protein